MSYVAPLKDMLFVLNELAGLSIVNALPGCEDATLETMEAVLEENAFTMDKPASSFSTNNMSFNGAT